VCYGGLGGSKISVITVFGLNFWHDMMGMGYMHFGGTPVAITVLLPHVQALSSLSNCSELFILTVITMHQVSAGRTCTVGKFKL
jgi:hypothetical protein